MEIDRIENVTPVRDISWQEDSEHITITTDDQVCNYIQKLLLIVCASCDNNSLHLRLYNMNFLNKHCLGVALSSGELWPDHHLSAVHSGGQSSVWLVFSGGQVFSQISVSEQLPVWEMAHQL